MDDSKVGLFALRSCCLFDHPVLEGARVCLFRHSAPCTLVGQIFAYSHELWGSLHVGGWESLVVFNIKASKFVKSHQFEIKFTLCTENWSIEEGTRTLDGLRVLG